ncbi:hypothetical protein HDC30_002479 [Pseudomonas sp. JAI115]|uniref:hypothetical protein n=1 Tax=Pseudomonas sp. JAI115 TaxID=2723061 RepID=UPI001622B64E|nr:hypothetical protein [Pseudomonas sp. JAI115]MBB6155256.1 hypothetical protein [Pseudomonas sp. JAI115]
MQTEPDLVADDVLNTCQTLNVFGEHASRSLIEGHSLPLSERDRAQLQEAFNLMRHALDRVQPLVARPFKEMHNWTLHDKDYPFL